MTTALGRVIAGTAILTAFFLLAPAATAEQKSRRPVIDNEGYTYLGGGPFGASSGPGFGASQGPFNFFQLQGPRLRGQTNAQPIGGNETETIGLGRTHTVRSGRTGTNGKVTVRGWDPGSKKQTTAAASGDPDRPVILGSPPNPAYQGARSSAWFRVQQQHTTGAVFPSRPFMPPGGMNRPFRR